MQLTSDQHQQIWNQMKFFLLSQPDLGCKNCPCITSPVLVWIHGMNPPIHLELFRASSTVGYLYSFRLNVFEERPPQHGEIRFEVSSGGTVRYVVDEDRTFDTLTDLCGWLTDSVIQGKRTLE